jgi:hypothetical protein
MKRIKRGNSFDMSYTCYVQDIRGIRIPVDFTIAQINRVAIITGTPVQEIECPYAIDGYSVVVNIDSDDLQTGIYRLLADFNYKGLEFNRNPKAFELVNNVEQEGDCHCQPDCDAGRSASVTDEITFIGNVSAQIQTDWEEADPTAPEYIKNKPTRLSQFYNDPGYATVQEVQTVSDSLSASILDESAARELADANLQLAIDQLQANGNIEGEVDAYAHLLQVDTEDMKPNTIYIVEADETHGGITTLYSWDGTQWVYAGKFNINLSANLVSFAPVAGLPVTDVQAAIEALNATIGDINTILDNINGEVI